jgi:hypothetical protein
MLSSIFKTVAFISEYLVRSIKRIIVNDIEFNIFFIPTLLGKLSLLNILKLAILYKRCEILK